MERAYRKIPKLKSLRSLTLKSKLHHKYSCSSAISTSAGKENKRRLQTLSIDNAWSNKNFLVYFTFRMLQHTSSEVNGYNCYVLIHYVQTNVNYLPLKYPQNQVQRNMGGSHADPNTFNILFFFFHRYISREKCNGS